MQVVVVIPEFITSPGHRSTSDLLMRNICGVPLLIRTLATVQRAGAGEILLISPMSVPDQLAQACIQSPLLRGSGAPRLVRVERFDPNDNSDWASLGDQLEDRFVWLPWNWVTHKQALASLTASGYSSTDWALPTWITRSALLAGETPKVLRGPRPEGIAVTSDDTAAAAERLLVARSGKVLDGIHTSFNRRLCWPVVRWLSHTAATPNAVTFGGVLVAALSAIAFAQGSYWWYVAGAFLFFIAGLFDEIDGMLARIKFADSPFGTWLEGFADGLSYLLLFGGITVGLYRQYGSRELLIGAALLTGTLLSLIVTSLGRKRATAPDRPNEYLGRFYRLLEEDSSNWISRLVRQAQAFQKRGVLIHYVFIFTVLGGLPLLFYLAALGSHLTWILALYFNHRFFSQPVQGADVAGIDIVREAS